jgi:hypothetical protein
MGTATEGTPYASNMLYSSLQADLSTMRPRALRERAAEMGVDEDVCRLRP